MRQLTRRIFLALTIACSATPVLADANFGTISLSTGFGKTTGITGYTGGSYSLSSIANRDRNNNPCLGFGSPNPDHTLELKNNFPELTLRVESGGNDSTLAIKGPDGVIRCGDDTGSSKDASITDKNWKAGKHEVWVGSLNAGQRWKYTLSIME